MTLWVTQAWHGGKWINSVHRNVMGWNVLIVFDTRREARAALAMERRGRLKASVKTRVVNIEVPE